MEHSMMMKTTMSFLFAAADRGVHHRIRRLRRRLLLLELWAVKWLVNGDVIHCPHFLHPHCCLLQDCHSGPGGLSSAPEMYLNCSHCCSKTVSDWRLTRKPAAIHSTPIHSIPLQV